MIKLLFCLGWNPLSEDEEKRLKAKRERSSKISKIMGNYLLRGYKMLGTTCNKCEVVKFQAFSYPSTVHANLLTSFTENVIFAVSFLVAFLCIYFEVFLFAIQVFFSKN